MSDLTPSEARLLRVMNTKCRIVLKEFENEPQQNDPRILRMLAQTRKLLDYSEKMLKGGER